MQKWEITDVAELATIIKEVRDQSHTANAAQVLALHGDLGAGKTTFTQQLAASLGVNEVVTSPTFVVMKQYETTDETVNLLVHIDAYRLEADEELAVLGFADLLTLPNTLIVIEWAEKVADLLPENTLQLWFSIEGNQRHITLDYGKEN